MHEFAFAIIPPLKIYILDVSAAGFATALVESSHVLQILW
jgi:hypothetical protein